MKVNVCSTDLDKAADFLYISATHDLNGWKHLPAIQKQIWREQVKEVLKCCGLTRVHLSSACHGVVETPARGPEGVSRQARGLYEGAE